MSEAGRRMMKVLLEYHEPVIAEDLASRLEIDIHALGWLRRKLNSKASEAGLDLDDLIEVTRQSIDGRLRTAYLATRVLRHDIMALENREHQVVRE